jgi:hypothetical protein
MTQKFEDNLTITVSCRCGRSEKFIGPKKWVYGWAIRRGWNPLWGGVFECPECAYLVSKSFDDVAEECMRGVCETCGSSVERLEFEGRCSIVEVP